MSPIAFLRGLFDRGPLLNADKPRWAAAQSLGDLGQLTARWLRGEIKSQPGYYGPVDVDEDIAPGITDALVTLNLAGLVTDQSQGGYDGPDYEAAPWEAWVTGYADDDMFWRLDRMLFGTGFHLYAWPAASMSDWSGRLPYGVSPVDGPIRGRLSTRDVRFLYGGCGDGAVEALLHAWQITIYDPQPGSNDLWPVLAAAFAGTAVAS